MIIEEKDELPLVMNEIREAMGAQSTALTIHPDDGRPPRALYSNGDGRVDRETVEMLLAGDQRWPDTRRGDTHAWAARTIDGVSHDMLLIPVERVAGHGRLIIIAVFADLDVAGHDEAEAVYLRRRPFAIGYFRLWQLERTRKRRIDALQSALNLMEIGVLLLDRESSIVFSNEAAERTLDREDGLRRRQDMLRAVNLQDGLRLRIAIDHVIEGGSGSVRERRTPIMAINRQVGPPLVLSILPTSEQPEEPSDVAAIVYLLDPALDTSQLLQPVCKFYNLTPVETKLVCLLGGGATMAQAAAAMHVKEQTGRSTLKQVFIKTGTNRQADLVRLMLSNLVRTARIFPIEVI